MTVLKAGDNVYFGDELSRQIVNQNHKCLLLDETVITLGRANSSITMDEFVYDPNTKQNGKIHNKHVLLKGSVKVLSGKISQREP